MDLIVTGGSSRNYLNNHGIIYKKAGLCYFIRVFMEFDNNPTRKQIIMLLKKNILQSVAQLSEHMSITPMAVRQHLMGLEKQGIITYKPKKSGIGRPVFLYSLTKKASDIFPKSYSDFVREMLSILEDEDGRK
ncbi:MAG TPA: ArsR family transcriptional regulator, partial [Nitrospirae bacterium]|nr:ArsR family transcriptional regulator [Nitrospirota bacterium]